MIESQESNSVSFRLDRSKHVSIGALLEDFCRQHEVKAQQEVVLVTQSEHRIILDVAAIEPEEPLKLVKIDPEVNAFKQQVHQLFQMQQLQTRQFQRVQPRTGLAPPSLLDHRPFGAPMKTLRIGPDGLPRRRGRPPKNRLEGPRPPVEARQLMLTSGADDFHQVKAIEKTALCNRLRTMCKAKGFEIQTPALLTQHNKEIVQVRCLAPNCCFRLVYAKDMGRNYDTTEFELTEIEAKHSHIIRYS